MFLLGHRSLGLQSSTLANTYLAHIFSSCTSRLNFPKQGYQWEIRPQHSQCHGSTGMSDISELPIASC